MLAHPDDVSVLVAGVELGLELADRAAFAKLISSYADHHLGPHPRTDGHDRRAGRTASRRLSRPGVRQAQRTCIWRDHCATIPRKRATHRNCPPPGPFLTW
ncbi:hypothetical protein ACQPZQ_25430 [Pseudonocardia sp. CA-142604]|uniref:hypothetical protein n=1 Tax=Pseudonocardia sp. CA-142604 TaxID=3240024 RepID=UPI003D92C58B